MENEKFIPDEKWEREVLEKLAEGSAPDHLLDICQDCAISLAALLGNARRTVQDPDADVDDYEKRMAVAEVMEKAAKMAVLLDAMKLRFGEDVAAEIEFLKTVERCFE